MISSRKARRRHVWSAIALGLVLPATGCQVEYAGMTLPSGKYMHDDVQYFAPGPHFPWANTQAATQRARMRAMGIEPDTAGVAPPPGTMLGVPGGGPGPVVPRAGGAPDPTQAGPRPTDVNIMPEPGRGVPPPPEPGGAPNVPPPTEGGVGTVPR